MYQGWRGSFANFLRRVRFSSAPQNGWHDIYTIIYYVNNQYHISNSFDRIAPVGNQCMDSNGTNYKANPKYCCNYFSCYLAI